MRLENLKVRAMLDIERDCVNSLRLHMSLSQEEFRQVRRDRDDTRERLRRLESYGLSTNSLTDVWKKSFAAQRATCAAIHTRLKTKAKMAVMATMEMVEMEMVDFMKCQPLNFKGTEGVVGLIRCALTWWNSHKRTIGTEAAFTMSWKELIKLDDECNSQEMNRFQKMEQNIRSKL
ncbi:hypothetical protein Tco_0768063 [Tanacetum coccineum]